MIEYFSRCGLKKKRQIINENFVGFFLQLLPLKMPSSLTRQGKPVYEKLKHMRTTKRIFSLLLFSKKLLAV